MEMLRIKEVMRRTSLSRMTLWRLERAGKFPARHQLTPNSVAWCEDKVDAWIESRPVAPSSARPPIHESRAQAH